MNIAARKRIAVPAISLGLALAAFGAGATGSGAVSVSSSLPQGSEPVNLDPAKFTTRIDNPYFPMRPGSRWVSREVENGQVQRVVVTVTSRTKVIDGIRSRVIHDVVSANGRPVEKTVDWYAQDSADNVWYMGENTKEFEHGKVVSTAGSWQAGVGGAQPGIAMPGHPKPGLRYRQEYDKGNAEDRAKVLSTDETRTVPYGSFSHVLLTKDVNPLKRNFVEHKYYARGVGPIETVQIAGGSSHEVLVSFTR